MGTYEADQPTHAPVSVVIVEDHELVREGLRALIERDQRFRVTGDASGVDQALEVIKRTVPDVILLDLRLGDEDGTEVPRALRSRGLAIPVLVLSAYERPTDLRTAMAAGATGYLLKDSPPSLLMDALQRSAKGERVIDQAFVPFLVGLPEEQAGTPNLTAREEEVLQLLAAGMSNRELAEHLGVAQSTAQKHVENLFRKFGIHDRTEMITMAFRSGLLD